MYRVVKRDGKIKDFNIEKIVDAITLAFEAKGKDLLQLTLLGFYV